MSDDTSSSPAFPSVPAWSRGESVAVGLAALVFTGLAASAWWTLVDDAYISARYSELFAHGHGLVYSAGQPPVEGVTNLLWTLTVGVGRVVGLPIISLMTGLGWVFALLGLAGVAGLARHLAIEARAPQVAVAAPLAVGVLALQPHWHVSATNGLESTMMAATVLWATWATFAAQGRRRWAAGALIAALPWVRPEGLAVVAGLGVWTLGKAALHAQAARAQGQSASDAARAVLVPTLLPPLLSVLFLFSWRLSVYGLWLPNTYYAKVAFPIEKLWDINDQYLLPETTTFGVLACAFIAAVLLTPWRGALRPGPAREALWSRLIAGCLALGLTAIPMTVYLWMPGLRLFLPTMALTVALLASGVARLPRTAAWGMTLLLWAGMGWFFSAQSARVFKYDGRHSVLPDNGAEIAAKHLARHAPRPGEVGSDDKDEVWLATRDAGVLAYYVGPDVNVAELHHRALTLPHPDNANTAIRETTPINPTFFISTVQREDAEKMAYQGDRIIAGRFTVPYDYLGRVEQHYHRYYDVYARSDAKIPPLPQTIVMNRKGPPVGKTKKKPAKPKPAAAPKPDARDEALATP